MLNEFMTSSRRPARDSRSSTVNRHILFLTDGIPTQGSTDNLLEQMGKQAGYGDVAIHTVFIGTLSSGSYPEQLDKIAALTGGAQFQAVPRKGKIQIFLRDERPGDLRDEVWNAHSRVHGARFV